MRLFIALEFSRKTRQSLSASAEVLRQICDKASLTREENFHLTLVFLGEIPPDRVKDIRAAMDECVAPPVRVSITGPGFVFPAVQSAGGTGIRHGGSNVYAPRDAGPAGASEKRLYF